MPGSSWSRWGAVLGFALGGFFDGILLHQILQWHHLSSLVPGLDDLRLQVLWDGYFHALMYIIAVAGIWGLWRTRRSTGEAQGRPLAGALLVGFGVWHVVDAILSHWLLGIHRGRLESDSPLLWDIIWFVVFGIVPLVAGWLLGRDGSGRAPSLRGSTTIALLALTGATIGAGAWSLRPPPDQPFTTVVFGPGTGPQHVAAALAAMDARLVWADPSMGVVVVDVAPGRRWGFYARGAWLVSGAGLPAGCFNWGRV